jgi:O-antigen/teichoic acid export membrane protein
LIKPVWLFLDARSHNAIGHKDFGLIASFFAITGILATIVDFGINQYSTKKIAANPEAQQTLYPVVFYYKLILVFLFPLALSLIGMAIGYTPKQLFYITLLGFVQSLTQLLFFLRAMFQGNQKFMIDSTASVLDKLVLIGLVIVLLSWNAMNLENFVYARIASFGISVLIYYIVSMKLFGFIKPVFDFNQLVEIVRISIPFGLINMLYATNERLDQYMIYSLAPHEDHSGHYAGGYRFLDAIMMYLWTILPIFFAKFAHHIQDHSAKQRLFNVGQIIASVPMTYVCMCIFFYGDKLFPLLLDNSTPEDLYAMSSILKILFLSAFLHGVFAIYHTLLTSTGYELKVAVMVVGSIVINIVLNYFVIPVHGAVGSAWVTLVSTTFLSFCYLAYIHWYTDIRVPYTILIRLAITYSGFGLSFYLLDTLLPSMSIEMFQRSYDLQWLVVCSLAGLFLIFFTWLTGLFRILIQKGEL